MPRRSFKNPALWELLGATQSAARGSRLHAGGARDNRGPVGACRERFVIPATFKIAFLLASCYFGGAIATELSHDALKVNPFIPLVLLWIGAFIRDRSIFL